MAKRQRKRVASDISFTTQELALIRTLSGRIGGTPDNSPRQHADSIREKIDSHLSWHDSSFEYLTRRYRDLIDGVGDIYFADYGKEVRE